MPTKDVSTLMVLRAVAEYRGRGCSPPRPLDLLEQWTGQPEKVCYRAMEREEGKGFLDCGVGLYIGWLTVAGKAELAKLEAGAVMTKTLVQRLRERLIAVPKPGEKPFDPPAGWVHTMTVGGEHKPGDDAGYMSINANMTGAAGLGQSTFKMQAMVYAVDPLCEEAALALESRVNEPPARR